MSLKSGGIGSIVGVRNYKALKIMSKEEQIASIKQRILDEHRKHKSLDWAEIAARKIYSTHLVKEKCNLPVVSERTLGINSCAALIESMPTDQAIQIMKSDITGHPQTVVIEGELVVAYVR
jgi:hypothetical protein